MRNGRYLLVERAPVEPGWYDVKIMMRGGIVSHRLEWDGIWYGYDELQDKHKNATIYWNPKEGE